MAHRGLRAVRRLRQYLQGDGGRRQASPPDDPAPRAPGEADRVPAALQHPLEVCYAIEIRGAVVTSPTSQQPSPRCSKPSRTAATFSAGTAKRRPPEVSDSNSRLTSASGSEGSIAS